MLSFPWVWEPKFFYLEVWRASKNPWNGPLTSSQNHNMSCLSIKILPYIIKFRTLLFGKSRSQRGLMFSWEVHKKRWSQFLIEVIYIYMYIAELQDGNLLRNVWKLCYVKFHAMFSQWLIINSLLVLINVIFLLWWFLQLENTKIPAFLINANSLSGIDLMETF